MTLNTESLNQCAAKERRFNWRRVKLLRSLDNKMRSITGWVGAKTSKYECHPNFNRFLAGVHVLTWTHFCGNGWRFAFKMAWIYWKPTFMRKS